MKIIATPLPLDGGGCACLPVGRGGGEQFIFIPLTPALSRQGRGGLFSV